MTDFSVSSICLPITDLSPTTDSWQIYINRLCLDTVLPLLQSWQSSAQPCWESAVLEDIWPLVDGTLLNWGNKRLALVPSETLEQDEFRVPQEWLDIPEWQADYYLAVQVDPDEGLVEVWGYATYDQLRANAVFDPCDRMFVLKETAQIQDLAFFGAVQTLNANESTADRPAPASLPPLGAATREQAITTLQASLLPRLELSFAQWGTLIADSAVRKALAGENTGEVVQTAVSLSRWLQGRFEEGWESLESLLGEQVVGYNFRRTYELESTVQRARLISLRDSAGDPGQLLLWLAVSPEADGKFAIRVQLRSTQRQQGLPEHLEFMLLSNSGTIVQTVMARPEDDYIQLKRFRCLPGKQFKVRVQINDVSVTESFVS